ncbi:MAG TPA: hypothetical protein VL485_08100, partial [Ktedonobacteraceae bacterium]|nr:hypothetical protein [Ktedonobacteraceae bacterium]
QLDIVHCTLMPHGIEAHHTTSRSTQFQIMIDHSIVGPLQLQRGNGTLRIQDSIIDGMSAPAITTLTSTHAAGITTHIERATIFGPVQLQELIQARNVIFTAPVYVQRQQTGMVSFSYVPESSQTPRRTHCQPDLALAQQNQSGKRKTSMEEEQIYLLFTSSRYGDPGYAQLSISCAPEIRRGAEGGSEMGAFHYLRQVQRQDNFYHALDEYFPFHLAINVFFVN